MKTFVFVLAASLLAARPAFADLSLTMKDGRVSIVAKNVTVRQILTEWMRVGQTRIVNVDRIPGDPVTLELNDVSEAQALEVLLRPLSGYIAAPRAVAAANLSNFDRIIIMPTLASSRPPIEPASSRPAPPALQQAAAVVAPEPPVERVTYEEQAPPDEPPPDPPAPSIPVAPGQANQSPTTFIPHAQETRRPGVLPNGIVPTMPKNPMPTGNIAPFGVVAIPGMVPGAPAPPARRP